MTIFSRIKYDNSKASLIHNKAKFIPNHSSPNYDIEGLEYPELRCRLPPETEVEVYP